MDTALAQVVERVREPLLAISEEDASATPSPGKWSKKQILGHLIDSAHNNHQRFVRLQLEREVTMPGYQQDDWVWVNAYHTRTWKQLVLFWVAYNLHLVCLVQRLDDTCLDHVWHHPSADYTLGFLVEDYMTHLQHHLRQIGVA